MRIERVEQTDTVMLGAELFDEPPTPARAEHFLRQPGHHLLFAWDDQHPHDRPIGFVSGVEILHPDKDPELYLNELGVADAAQRQGVGTALVRALADLARAHGCVAMWEVSDADNQAATATYRRSGADEGSPTNVFTWSW
jgi:aminoglycoside 3-N-acetyltransferase I